MSFERRHFENPVDKISNKEKFRARVNNSICAFLALMASGCDANNGNKEVSNSSPMGGVESTFSSDELESIQNVSATCNNSLDNTEPCEAIVADMKRCVESGINPINCENINRDEISAFARQERTSGNKVESEHEYGKKRGEKFSPQTESLIKKARRE